MSKREVAYVRGKYKPRKPRETPLQRQVKAMEKLEKFKKELMIAINTAYNNNWTLGPVYDRSIKLPNSFLTEEEIYSIYGTASKNLFLEWFFAKRVLNVGARNRLRREVNAGLICKDEFLRLMLNEGNPVNYIMHEERRLDADKLITNRLQGLPYEL